MTVFVVHLNNPGGVTARLKQTYPTRAEAVRILNGCFKGRGWVTQEQYLDKEAPLA